MKIFKREKWYVWAVLYHWHDDLERHDLSTGVVRARDEKQALERVEEFNREVNSRWTPVTTKISQIPPSKVKQAIPQPFLWKEWLLQLFFGRKIRVDAVVGEYLKASVWRDDIWLEHGLARLQRANVTCLESQREMDEACSTIYRRLSNHRHPNWLGEVLDNRRLLEFFKWCDDHKMDLSHPADCCSAIWLFNQDWFEDLVRAN